MADATSVQTTAYGFSPEAAPYAQDLLGQAQALTDINANPYMQYQGDTVAQFSPLQNQSYENAALMQTAPQLQDATAMAGMAGLGALNTGYTYNPYQSAQVNAPNITNYQMQGPSDVKTQSFTSPGVAKSYMNPFLDVQNSAAYRNAAIANAASNAQATTAGAFGGGRQAIMGAQNNADLQRNLGQNQFNAYNQAQGQFNTEQGANLQAQLANQNMGYNVGNTNLQANLGVQQLGANQNLQAQLANQGANQSAANLNAQQGQFGAGLGLQGLQTALTGANALSNIGQTQYGQNMGINQLQNQYGGQQQQQAQNILNQQQQQFLNYQNYPYQQLNFMQNMIRGLPMTNQTASVYQSPGSMLGQVAGLGIGAAAALKKDGGYISSFKEGGYVKKYSGEDEESLVRLSPFAMKQLMGDTAMSGAGVNANADLHEAGRLSGGVNLNRMDKGMDSRQMQSLMANYMNEIGDVGVNANVSRPLERNLPADFYQTNLMGSIPVGEGRLTVGKHGTHAGGEHHTNAHSLAYNTPFHGGRLNAHVNKPVEGRPSYGVQYNRSFAEGGDVGDITDPSEGKLHRMMGSLNEQQLQQILQHPTSMAEFEAAQQVMSFRQSVHQGMREGGAVAFADGGSNGLGVYSGGDIAPPNEAGMGIGKALGLPFSNMSQFIDYINPNEPAWKKKLRKEQNYDYDMENKVGGGRGTVNYSDKYDTYLAGKSSEKAEKARLLQDELKKSNLKDVAKNAPSLGEARRAAEGMGVKAEDFDSIYKRVLGDLSKGNADIIKSIRELTEEQVGEAKNIKAEGGRKALMNFGFNMAAEASRPGQPGNKGFAGLLRSAAAASPSYAASLADTDKLARESQRLANQMQIEMTKYQVQLDKNDKAGAIQSAHNIQANQIQQQNLAEVRRHNEADEKNKAAHTGMLAEHYKAAGNNNSFKLANLNARAIEMGKKQADSDYKSKPMLMADKNMTPAKLAEQYSKQYYSQLLRSMSGPLMPLED